MPTCPHSTWGVAPFRCPFNSFLSLLGREPWGGARNHLDRMTLACPALLWTWLVTSKAPAGASQSMALRRAGRGQTLQLPVSSVTCSGRAPTPSPLATCARTWHPAARSVHPGQALTQGFQRNWSLPTPPPEPSSGLDAAVSARSSPGATGLNCVMPGRFLHLSEPQFPVC